MANQRFLAMPLQWFSNLTQVKKITLIVFLLLGMFLFCRLPTTFRVLDAETGSPIEGAVALAMWDSTRGLPGLSSSYTAKAIEAVSDGNGILTIPFLFGRGALFTPRFKVYKPGYVGWDSILTYLGCHEKNKIVPVYKEREGFSMKDQDIFLEPWKDEYTFVSHGSFIRPKTNLRKDAGITDSTYRKIIDFERPFRIRERNANYNNRK